MRPRRSRGTLSATWSRGAIRQILRNPLFRGEIVWNVSSRHRHPETGKIKRWIKPPHEHIRRAAEHLRIVEDELWFKAAERLKQLKDQKANRMLVGR